VAEEFLHLIVDRETQRKRERGREREREELSGVPI
jgi:hypothetical protein